MFSPKDIRDTEFDKIVRGYNPEDVDAFLKQLADQVESLQNDKAAAEDKMMLLAERIESYKKDEETLRNALITAERLKEAVVMEAKQKAEIIVNEAQMTADKLVSDAQSSAERIMTEAEAVRVREQEAFELLQKRVSAFKAEILGLYKSHLELINNVPGDAPAVEEVPAADEAPVLEETAEVPAEDAAPVVEEIVAEPVAEEIVEEIIPAAEPAVDAAPVETPVFDDLAAEANPFATFNAAPAAENTKNTSRFGALDFGDNFTFDK